MYLECYYYYFVVVILKMLGEILGFEKLRNSNIGDILGGWVCKVILREWF